MIVCELCGTHDTLTPTLIEGVKLNVCRKCGNYGKISNEQKQTNFSLSQNNQPEKIDIIRSDYSNVIKTAREKLGLTQKELAEKIKEKESIIPKIESGSYKPDLIIAKKLEKFLDLHLILVSENVTVVNTKDNISLTIGDFIKIKK